MRISIYKAADGELSAFVEASVGKGRAPVLLKGITEENVTQEIQPVVVAMRKPKGEVADL